MNKPKWIRLTEKKLTNFGAAAAARTEWLISHPNTDATAHARPAQFERPAYKARIKARANGTFAFVTWSAARKGVN